MARNRLMLKCLVVLLGIVGLYDDSRASTPPARVVPEACTGFFDDMGLDSSPRDEETQGGSCIFCIMMGICPDQWHVNCICQIMGDWDCNTGGTCYSNSWLCPGSSAQVLCFI